MPNTKEKSGKYFKVFVCLKVQGNWGHKSFKRLGDALKHRILWWPKRCSKKLWRIDL